MEVYFFKNHKDGSEKVEVGKESNTNLEVDLPHIVDKSIDFLRTFQGTSKNLIFHLQDLKKKENLKVITNKVTETLDEIQRLYDTLASFSHEKKTLMK